MKKVCFVSVSGGKDSALTLALALEKYQGVVPVIPFFCDTLWEHPVTYSYLNGLEDFFGIKIERLTGFNGGMMGLIRKKKTFPSPRRRFCTQYLKVKPAYLFYNQLYERLGFQTAEVWIGMRRGESIYRRGIEDKVQGPGKTKFGERFSFELRFVYPIKDLSTMQVFRELKRRNIPINPLYEMGYERVGCFPCFCSKRDILTVMKDAIGGDEIAAQRVADMKSLEDEIRKKYPKVRLHVDYSFDELYRMAAIEAKQLVLDL